MPGNPDEPVDLAYLRDLLGLLRDMKVQGFSKGDLAITFFRDLDAELISVDGKPVHDSPTPEVRGFKPEVPKSAFKNPSLWPTGKPYSFSDLE